MNTQAAAGDFKLALQSANVVTEPGDTSPSHDAKSDAQNKAKRKDETATSADAVQVAPIQQPVIVPAQHAAVELLGQGIVPQQGEKPVSDGGSDADQVARLTTSSAQLTAGPGVDGANQSAASDNMAAPGSENAGTDFGGKEQVAAPHQPAHSATEASKTAQTDANDIPVNAATALPQPTADGISPAIPPVTPGLPFATTATPATGTPIPANATNETPMALPSLQTANSDLPVNVAISGQAPALPALDPLKTTIPGTPSQSFSNASSLINSDQKSSGTATSGSSKNIAGTDTRTRRKPDGSDTRGIGLSSDSKFEALLPRSPAGSSDPVTQISQQVQAGTAGPEPAAANDQSPANAPDSASSGSVAPQAAAPDPNSLSMPAQALSSAHLVQSIHQSEMKLGLNSAEFGSISISTSVTHQALSAQISLEHPELSRILSGHMPAIEEKLGQAYGLQAKVEVRDSGSAMQGGGREQSSSDRRPERMAAQSALSGNARSIGSLVAASSMAESTRLDVQV